MPVMSSIFAALLAVCVAAAGAGAGAAEPTISAEVTNFSEMDRWVQVTDLVCGTVLFKDKMQAQAKLPVKLCADDSGKGKVQFYIRIGCTKNQTVVKEGIEQGALVNF